MVVQEFWNFTSRKHVPKVNRVGNVYFSVQCLTKTIIAYGLRGPSSMFKENKSSWTVFSLIIYFGQRLLRLSELHQKDH